jgi:pyruvoyl-dependent arginine decarboxylase (PvlArgDC)
MTKPTIIRQGDVLVLPCATIPAAARAVDAEAGRLILARGEATGHHHSIALNPRICMFRDDGAGGSLYLKADTAVSLEHQEHHALNIAPGTYEVRIQRTVQTGVARRVAD